jgi:hypothetical protein
MQSYNKEQAEKAVELVATDKQRAYNIAMGIEQSAEYLSTSVNIALAEKALDEGNFTLYNTLVKNRSFEQTRRGQEIVAEKGSITDNSTTRYVKELLASRLAELGKNYTSDIKLETKSAKAKGLERIKTETKKMKKTVSEAKMMDVQRAQKFIDSLICK